MSVSLSSFSSWCCWMTNSDCLIRLIFKILLLYIYLGVIVLLAPFVSLSLFSEEEENKKSNSRVVVIACQQQQTNIPHRSLSTVLVFSSAGRIKTKKNNFFVFGPNDVAALTHGATYNGSVHRFHVSFSIPHLQG